MLTSSGIRARIARAKSAERRTGRRFRPSSLSASAQVVSVVGGQHWFANVRNVSSTGASLVCPHSVEPGSLFTLEFVNAKGTFACTVVAWVVHVNAHPRGIVAGCAFTKGLNEEDLGRLIA
jgi:hypothetical protein